MGMLNGKVVIVTGASSGIGFGTALVLAAEGAKVVASARRTEQGQKLISLIKDQGGEATWVSADVRVESDVRNLVRATVDTYGRLDCAFNNAGTGIMKPLHEQTNEDYDMQMDVNVRGVFWCMKYQLEAMLASGGGSIVNCASVGATGAFPGISVYSATKAAVVSLTKGAAVEYAQRGIRVNAVSPGVVESELATVGWRLDDPQGRAFASALHPMNRVGKPQEIGDVVAFLCSDKASFLTGQDLAVDGGLLAAANGATQMLAPR
ncbi:glucose 1-dehydrogenase [Pyxidicoccus sp. 3LFB2]